MMHQSSIKYPKGASIIKQEEASLKKKRTLCCGKQSRTVRIMILVFGLMCVFLTCLMVVTFLLIKEDDVVENDLNYVMELRKQLEGNISYWNQHFINKDGNSSTPETMLSKPERGFIMMAIIKDMSTRLQLPFKNLSTSEYHNRLFYDAVKDLCHPEVTCVQNEILSPYSKLDGSCNNFNNPQWGMAGRAQKRLLKSFYEDGFGAPRSNGVDGLPLPSPRFVSNRIHRPASVDRNDTSATVMVMAFGQFFDHDLMLTPMTKASNGEPIPCCTEEAKMTKGPLEACAPIDIPNDDDHFPPNSCMNFSRSAPSVCDSCGMCQREQINAMTSFIDASQVYGVSKAKCNELREFRFGFLKTTSPAPNHHILLPQNADNPTCTLSDKKQFCFDAGDARVNVVPNLSSLHTMFVREHNRIAGQLTRINPHWDDERLFQEARKILIGVTQQIVYNEYLPIVLGDETMRTYNLKIAQTGFAEVYNDMVDPRISTSFSAATFRFGHSTVPNHQKAMDQYYAVKEVIPIENTFNDPNVTFSYCNGVARWLVQENAVKTDGFLSHGVRNMLFHNNFHHNNSFDLASLNIQRGRDHGIAPYNYWRHFCGLPVITPADFNNTGKSMGDFMPATADVFRTTYRHPDDIDLFSGAMKEIRMYNAHVGPTFACLMGKEFRRLKEGDRFYFENPPKHGLPFVGFTAGQLSTIKQFRFSKTVCETMSTPTIQPDVMRPPNNNTNRLTQCDSLPDLDFTQWREEQS